MTENVCVHIFRQVAMDTEPDNVATEIILERLEPGIKSQVIYHKEDYLLQELCWLYGNMDYFIGTRLHSTIFSMRAGTPAIGIVYHGTKAQGIFENIGVPELIVKGEVTSKKLLDTYAYMKHNRDDVVRRIKQGVNSARSEMVAAIQYIIHNTKGD